MNTAGPNLFIYWFVAAIGLLLPTGVTWVYFVALHGSPAAFQQTAYAALKLAQFGLPIAVVCFSVNRSLRYVRWHGPGWWWGLGFGLSVVIAMILVYRMLLADGPLAERLVTMLVEKIRSMGLNTPVRFLLVSVFYAVVHSGLEEYYWRWFVFRWLRNRCSIATALMVSSLGFGLHHILLLGFFLGFQVWETWFLSAAVAIGGLFWAGLYHRSGDAVGPIWLSHAVVDAGIFGLGFWLLRSEFGLN